MSAETIPSEVVELVAKTIHDHWQGAPGLSARPWDGEKGTCTKLPAQAEDFRRKARAVMEALATRPAEPAAPVAEAVGYMRQKDADAGWFWVTRRGNGYYTEPLVRLSTLEAERARADAAEQRAAVALARAEKALETAQGALVDLADWLENDCDAELPHSHIEKQVALARSASPRALREAQPATDGGKA